MGQQIVPTCTYIQLLFKDRIVFRRGLSIFLGIKEGNNMKNDLKNVI